MAEQIWYFGIDFFDPSSSLSPQGTLHARPEELLIMPDSNEASAALSLKAAELETVISLMGPTI
jgi:hypothetical protein